MPIEIAEVRRRPARRSGRSAPGRRAPPSRPASASQRGMGEVVEGHHRREPELVAGGAHPPVVVERGPRPLALVRLDPAPLEREPVGAEPEGGHQVDVLGVAVARVAGVAARRRRTADAGSCSKAHQSLLTLPPSIWWAAVAVPHRNPSGKAVGMVGTVAAPRVARRRPACHLAGWAVSDALDFLVNLLDLEPIEVNIFRGVSPDEDRQRVFGGQVAAQALMAAGRTVERGPRPLAARLLPAPRRPERAHPLRGRPHPRRPVVHHPPGGGHPARPGHLQPVGLVPRRRGRAFDHQFPMPEVPDPETLPTRWTTGSSPTGTSSATGSPGPTPSTSATSASCPGCSTRPAGPRPAAVDPGRRHPARRPPAPRLRRRLRLGHVAVRHHARPPRGAAGTTPTSWGPASTTACGSTGPSGPTSGCSTTWTAPTPSAPGAWPGASSSPATGRWSCRWSRRA